MAKTLTIHLLTKNNEKTIREAIESVLPFSCPIIVGDLHSTDKTTAICNDYGIHVVDLQNGDRSKLRNQIVQMSKTEWQMYIEPWECVYQGQEVIEQHIETKNTSLRFEVYNDDVVTKQIRLWRKNKLTFSNPLYETLTDDQAEQSNVVILTGEGNVNYDLKIIEQWKKTKPTATEPYYYCACTLLAQKRYQEFIKEAEYFIFHESKPTVAAIMTRYYCGIVHCCITNRLTEAAKQAMLCIAEQPLMAEFWCLLGDIHLRLHRFDKAIAFYENAVILGGRRLRNDRWPIHISKYKEYPEEMIERANRIISKTTPFIPAN